MTELGVANGSESGQILPSLSNAHCLYFSFSVVYFYSSRIFKIFPFLLPFFVFEFLFFFLIFIIGYKLNLCSISTTCDYFCLVRVPASFSFFFFLMNYRLLLCLCGNGAGRNFFWPEKFSEVFNFCLVE